jgi:NADH-quinone oxidoreductase subunit H
MNFASILNWWQTHIPPWVLITLIIHGAVLGTVAYLILLERKVASWVQDRIGPNRVGPYGLLQPIADGLKFILKEDYRPKGVDTILFSVAPMVMIGVIILSVVTLPWGGTKESTAWIDVAPALGAEHNGELAAKAQEPGADNQRAIELASHAMPVGDEVLKDKPMTVQSVGHPDGTYEVNVYLSYRYPFQITSLNTGVLLILAFLSLAVYGVVIGGWASNNKYSFLGGLRACANMISYEVPMGLAVLCIVVMYGTLDLNEMSSRQAHYWLGFIPAWNVFVQPLTFLLFLVCIHAEANRAPFDLAEAEQELVGGYHTEYSAMRFALFFLAEYAGMITTSAICAAMFFGGWHFPGVDRLVCWIVNSISHSGAWVDPTNPAITNSFFVCLVRAAVIFTKTLLIIFVFMWVRWSLPRFRFDQLMMIAWRALIPISLALLMVTAIVVYIYPTPIPSGAAIPGHQALALLIANVAVLIFSMIVSVIAPMQDTNRPVAVPGSRYRKTLLPAGVSGQ